MIRYGTLKDTDSIKELLAQLGYKITTDLLKEKIIRILKDPNYKILIYEEDGETIGHLMLHFSTVFIQEKDVMKLFSFIVKDSARGKGVGKKLLEKSIELAKERDCSTIEVFCASRRKEAHKFYEANGFQETQKFYVQHI